MSQSDSSEIDQRLKERDDLIKLLTKKLEQTVAQLDQSKTQASVGATAASEPLPLVEQSPRKSGLVASDSSDRSMEILVRIETRLNQLLALIGGDLSPGNRELFPEQQAENPSFESENALPEPHDPLRSTWSWETMKARLQEKNPNTFEEEDPGEENDMEDEISYQSEAETEPSDASDVSTASIGEEQSEDSSKVLEDLTEEEASQYQLLEDSLRNRTRKLEVELALERARLAREASRLESLEQKLRQSGIDVHEIEEETVKESDTVVRWKRFLGVSNEDE